MLTISKVGETLLPYVTIIKEGFVCNGKEQFWCKSDNSQNGQHVSFFAWKDKYVLNYLLQTY
jgi:hypothetical protein